MEQVNLNDIIFLPVENSVHREKISDELYFSNIYKKYTSNSKLRNINPEQGGTPAEYFEGGFGPKTASLAIGTGVHCAILEPEEFEIAPALGRPSGKLGDVLDRVKCYRRRGFSIYDSIKRSCLDCDYYKNSIDSKVKYIIQKGLSYYIKSSRIKPNAIILPDGDREKCLASIKSLQNNRLAQSILHPTDDFGDPIPSFNEEAFFMDYVIIHNNRACIIPFKLKIDNWTIDVENKVLTLNDLKTTGKCVNWFMNEEYGSFYKFHYHRQFLIYADILKKYCEKEYGFDNSWTFNANVCVVETFGEHQSKCFRVSDELMESARVEFNTLMKMVGFYTLNGYKDIVEFV